MPARALPPIQHNRDRPGTVLSPSILSSDFARLAEECQRMLSLGADWLHVDVMDGHFVPNLTIGAPVVESLRKRTDAFLDCHLMVTDPSLWVESFAQAGADMYTFHLEAVAPPSSQQGALHPEVVELSRKVKAAGMHVGVALKPSTQVTDIFPYVDEGLVDMVLILTVEPGFGGQKFMEHVVGKCRVLRERYPHLNIEVDGGVSPSTIERVAAEGANVIVAGSAIFGASDPGAVLSCLRTSVDQAAEKAQG